MKLPTLFVIGLIALALAGCGSDGATNSAESVVFTITTQDLKFVPNLLTVKAGQAVRLTLNDVDTVLHDFALVDIPIEGEMRVVKGPAESADHDMGSMDMGDEMEFAVHTAIDVGDESVIVFTPSEPGTYRFICTVEGHEASGMVGQLIVEP